MRIDVKDTAKILAGLDNVLILTHSNPDGDTLGSGFALCRALLRMGKKARVACSDEIPKKYGYLFRDMEPLPLNRNISLQWMLRTQS